MTISSKTRFHGASLNLQGLRGSASGGVSMSPLCHRVGASNEQLAPIDDMLTILAYDSDADNPPGMYIDGRNSWDNMKPVWRLLQFFLGIDPPASVNSLKGSARRWHRPFLR